MLLENMVTLLFNFPVFSFPEDVIRFGIPSNLCFPENPPRILLLLPPSARQRVSRYPFPLIYAFPRIPAPVHTLQGLPAPILLSLPLFLLLFLFFARSPVLLLSAFSFPLLR